MMKISITSIVLIIAFGSQAFAQGDLHVKGKIRSDSLVNPNYLIIYADSTGTLDTLPAGLPGQVLISNGQGGKPYWGMSGGGDTILYTGFTQVGTDADMLEKVLGSYTMPGNTLSTDGSWIEIEAFGTISNQSGSTIIKLKFGGDIIAEIIYGSPPSLSFGFQARVYRINNNFQKSFETVWYNTNYINTHAQNLTGNVSIEFTGQNGSPIANNIVLSVFTVLLIR